MIGVRAGAARDPAADRRRPRRAGLPREKVLAAVVQLLEKTLIRVGNDEYARHEPLVRADHPARRHVEITAGASLRVPRQERSRARGRARTTAVSRGSSRRAAICLATIFSSSSMTRATAGRSVRRTSTPTFARSAGSDFTAKDFRTWAGTVLARDAAARFDAFDSRRRRSGTSCSAVESVAKRLGNTKAVCRKCYIHPAIFDAYLEGSMIKAMEQGARRMRIAALSGDEVAVLRAPAASRLRKTSAAAPRPGTTIYRAEIRMPPFVPSILIDGPPPFRRPSGAGAWTRSSRC